MSLASLAVLATLAGFAALAAESPSPASAPSVAPSVSAEIAVPSPRAAPSQAAPEPVPSPAPAASPSPSAMPEKKGAKAPKKKAGSSTPKKSAKAGSAGAGHKKLPPLLHEVEAHYAETSTLIADFEQINTNAALGTQKKSQGLIKVKRPDKVRWETKTPDANLLVSDGRTFWFYTPPFDEGERGQLIERKSSEVQSKLANALLAGSFSIARDMVIEKKSDRRFTLVPRAGSAGTIQKAEIEVDPAKKQIEKVILEHRGGNRSIITLANIRLGESLDDGEFLFKAPPNTDRVDPAKE